MLKGKHILRAVLPVAVVMLSACTVAMQDWTATGTGQPPNLLDGGDGRPTTNGGTLDMNSSAVELLENTSEAHNWTFEGHAGQAVAIAVYGAGSDPRVTLIDPNNKVLGMDDDGGGSLDSLLQLTLPEDGIYTIRVDMLNGGLYTVAVSERY